MKPSDKKKIAHEASIKKKAGQVQRKNQELREQTTHAIMELATMQAVAKKAMRFWRDTQEYAQAILLQAVNVLESAIAEENIAISEREEEFEKAKAARSFFERRKDEVTPDMQRLSNAIQRANDFKGLHQRQLAIIKGRLEVYTVRTILGLDSSYTLETVAGMVGVSEERMLQIMQEIDAEARAKYPEEAKEHDAKAAEAAKKLQAEADQKLVEELQKKTGGKISEAGFAPDEGGVEGQRVEEDEDYRKAAHLAPLGLPKSEPVYFEPNIDLKKTLAKSAEQAGMINQYTCEKCGGRIFTILRHTGTTPFMIKCRAKKDCTGFMQSAGYRIQRETGINGKIEPIPTYEWRRPTLEEYATDKPARKQYHDAGGLDIHRITLERPAGLL